MTFNKLKKFIFLILLSLVSCNDAPIDIRNNYLKKGITEKDKQLGLELLDKIEDAYGGRTNWENYSYAEFKQKADWYGRTKMSKWDTLPQLFKMNCELGNNNSELTLMNGKNKGSKYWIEDDIYKKLTKDSSKIVISKNKYHEKMIFKSYWFQLPFRIREAQIIAYGGEEKLNGKTYNILYATWGNEKANKDYDQFVIYLDKTTSKIEMLYFTLRDKIKKISLTAEFKDFRKTNEFELPYSQFVRYGKPSSNGVKFHENHYLEISFK